MVLFCVLGFTPLCFNAPYQFTPLPNLRPVIFGLTLFGWFIQFICIFFMGTQFFIYAHFYFPPLYPEHLGPQTLAWCILKAEYV
jgi:hypothetical protein